MEDESCLRRVILVGALFFTHALSSGLSLSFGVFYLPLIDTFDSSSYFTAWIGSTNTGLLCAFGKNKADCASHVSLKNIFLGEKF